ncbi:hypothetical protein GOODEAATRI_004779 [Goodea atripinnis]|uniref:TLC domain-containing protein n=1 Tax=Goodea atripinnis TaxID=208336 RepID=A0ABV0PKW5_9TELE
MFYSADGLCMDQHLQSLTEQQSYKRVSIKRKTSRPLCGTPDARTQLSLQDCWLHKANGGMVLVTFFMCRIALFPFMYWMYGRHYGIPLYSVPFHLPLSTNLGNSCILAPQVYWFVLLCRKGYRLYRRSRGPPSPPAANTSKED